MFMADIPIGAVDPPVCCTGVSFPSLPIENAETSFDPEFATYKKVPAESITIKVGEVPVPARGVTSVKPPVLEIVYSETLLLPEFAAYRFLPDGSRSSASTPCPAEIGLPESCVSTPEFGSSRYATISFEVGIAANKYRLFVFPQPNHAPVLAQTSKRAAALCSIRYSSRDF
jgi:hypothetical protein